MYRWMYKDGCLSYWGTRAPNNSIMETLPVKTPFVSNMVKCTFAQLFSMLHCNMNRYLFYDLSAAVSRVAINFLFTMIASLSDGAIDFSWKQFSIHCQILTVQIQNASVNKEWNQLALFVSPKAWCYNILVSVPTFQKISFPIFKNCML